MDKQRVRQIRDLINRELAALGERLNVKFEAVGARYTSDCARFNLEVGEIDAEGKTHSVERADFERYARRYGLLATDLDKEFEIGGHWYKIVGAAPKSRKYPILGQKIGTDRVYKFQPYQVKTALEQQPVRNGGA